MRILKRLMVLVLAVGCFASAAATERGEKTFGVKAGYVTKNRSALGGLVFTYSFSRHVRIAPQVGVIFRSRDLDALVVDADVHFPLSLPGKVDFYPLVGVGFNSWNRHGIDPADGRDVSTHVNCAGINAGAGVELRPSGALKLSLEARYTLLRHYPNAQFMAGIAFVF